MLQIRDFYEASADTLRAVESQLESWSESDSAPFPDFTPGEKSELRGAIELSPRSDKS